MIDGHDREQWRHTAHVLAQLHEVTRPIRQFFVEGKIPAKGPNDFDPFELIKKPKTKKAASAMTLKNQIKAMAPAYAIPRKEKAHGDGC